MFSSQIRTFLVLTALSVVLFAAPSVGHAEDDDPSTSRVQAVIDLSTYRPSRLQVQPRLVLGLDPVLLGAGGGLEQPFCLGQVRCGRSSQAVKRVGHRQRMGRGGERCKMCDLRSEMIPRNPPSPIPYLKSLLSHPTPRISFPTSTPESPFDTAHKYLHFS